MKNLTMESSLLSGDDTQVQYETLWSVVLEPLLSYKQVLKTVPHGLWMALNVSTSPF